MSSWISVKTLPHETSVIHTVKHPSLTAQSCWLCRCVCLISPLFCCCCCCCHCHHCVVWLRTCIHRIPFALKSHQMAYCRSSLIRGLCLSVSTVIVSLCRLIVSLFLSDSSSIWFSITTRSGCSLASLWTLWLNEESESGVSTLSGVDASSVDVYLPPK